MTGDVADGSNEGFTGVKVGLGCPPVGKMLGSLDRKPLGSSKLFVGFGLPGAVPTTGTAMAELLISKHKTLSTLFEIIEMERGK